MKFGYIDIVLQLLEGKSNIYNWSFLKDCVGDNVVFLRALEYKKKCFSMTAIWIDLKVCYRNKEIITTLA